MSDKSPEYLAGLRDLFTTMGAALYHAQNFETLLLGAVVLTRTADGRYESEEEQAADMEKLAKLTAGQLVEKHLKSDGLVDPGQVGRWDEIVKVRNRLAHRFFHEHGWALYTTKGLQRMQADMRGVFEQVEAAEEEVRQLAQRLVAESGQMDDLDGWMTDQIRRQRELDGEDARGYAK